MLSLYSQFYLQSLIIGHKCRMITDNTSYMSAYMCQRGMSVVWYWNLLLVISKSKIWSIKLRLLKSYPNSQFRKIQEFFGSPGLFIKISLIYLPVLSVHLSICYLYIRCCRCQTNWRLRRIITYVENMIFVMIHKKIGIYYQMKQ